MQHSDQIVSARNELMALRNQLGRTIISPKSPRQLSPYNEGAQSFTSRSRSTFSMLQPNMSSVTAGTSPGSQRQETPIHAQGTYPGEDTRANFSWQLRAYQSDEKRRFEDAVREDAAHHIALKVEEAHQNISRKFCVDLDVEVQRIKEIEEENTRISTEAANRAFQQEIESLNEQLTTTYTELEDVKLQVEGNMNQLVYHGTMLNAFNTVIQNPEYFTQLMSPYNVNPYTNYNNTI